MSPVLVALVASLRAWFRRRAELEVEILALRHQLAVLQRSAARRASLNRADRLLWVLLRNFWPNWRQSIHIVRPATVVRWHRRAFACYWRWKSRPPPHGRPPVTQEVRA
jgi:putative transposase